MKNRVLFYLFALAVLYVGTTFAMKIFDKLHIDLSDIVIVEDK